MNYFHKEIDGAQYWTKKKDYTLVHLCLFIATVYVYATTVLFITGKVCF